MKFSKQAKANILKRVRDFSGDAAKAVEKHLKKELDVDDLSDDWVRKNVDRIRVKKDGATVDIENKTFRNMASKLNPFRKGVKVDADLDSGQIRGVRQNKRMVTKFEKDPSKTSDGGWKSNVKKLMGIGGAGVAAGAGGTAYATSKSEDSAKQRSQKKNKDLKQKYLNYVRQKRQGI